MRKGWRGAWSVCGVVLLLVGTAAGAGTRSGRLDNTAIRLTLDLSWGDPSLPTLPVGTKPTEETVLEVEIGEGRILEACSDQDAPWTPRPGPDGTYRLGTGQSGKVRVRIETTSSSTLVAKAGGLATRFGVSGLFEAPMRTAANSPVPIQIERVPWDSLEVRLGPEGGTDGVFAPGSPIPTTLAFNILVPEPTEVGVKYWAELHPARGGDPVWTSPARHEVISTNATRPPGVRFSIPAPKVEGSYVLAVHATWEPAANAEGSRLARLFKKRRGNSPVDVMRSVSFVVMGAQEPARPLVVPSEAISDSLDLTRGRTVRTMSTGRSPLSGASWTIPDSALVDPSRRDRLRGWMPFGGTEGSVLGPADSRGLSWAATALRVNHPGRPHRLVVKVSDGKPTDLGVALLATGRPGGKPRMILDAAACGAAPPDASSPTTFSWPVWPSSDEAMLVMVNRSDLSPVRVSSVELRELVNEPEMLAPAAMTEVHPKAPRPLALHLAGPRSLDRFGGTDETGDVWSLAQNVGAYALHCGASAIVLASAPSERKRRSALDGQAEEDATKPDRTDVILRVLARKKLSALLEVHFNGNLPGLPPLESAEAVTQGIVRIDRNGRGDGRAYQPLRGEVRQAMMTRVVTSIEPRAKHPNVLGLVVKLGPGSTLPGSPDVGLDDVTFQEFVRSAFQPDAVAKVPGLNQGDPKRFMARWQFVNGPGREDWLDWRAEQLGMLYGEMASQLKKAAPGAVLAVATPGIDDGPAGVEARRADRNVLSPSYGWKAVGLDLARWPTGPVVLRGVGLSTDDLGHDLATNPDLDAAVVTRADRGLWYGVDDEPDSGDPLRLNTRPIPEGPLGDEPFGHALAVLDARWVIVSGSAIAGQEERLARFARVYRALPALPETTPLAPRLDSGVAVRSWVESDKTYIAMANDTPYVVFIESVLHAPSDATVEDLGRRQRLMPAAAPSGGKSLVLELPPFGVAAIRVGSPTARIVPISIPYLPAGRDLDARREQLSVLLDKMVQGESGTLPRNGDFEDSRPVRVVPVSEARPPRSQSATLSPRPTGWSVEGDGAGALNCDTVEPHSGKSSLRVITRGAGVSVASAAFASPGSGPLTLRCWIRADKPDSGVKVWVEGHAGGRPFSRSLDTKVGLEWTEVSVALNELPELGLDRVRIRFEKKTAGSLWIDDVSLEGEGPAESTRRAQLVLTAALHAYREKRYADFARLAGSHWAKEAELDGEFGPLDRAGPIRAAGTPTDLPSGRRLR